MKRRCLISIIILLVVIVAAIGIFLWQRSHVSFYSDESGNKSVVIGGADGPTAIFIAGKNNGNDQETVESEEGISVMGVVEICVGGSMLEMILEENESTKDLLELLKEKDIIMPASNYGGFEKVCKLGTSITRNDEQITTEAGDVMLYQGNQIVIFYDSNAWAYTRIGHIDTTQEILEEVLSGDDSEVILRLVQ